MNPTPKEKCEHEWIQKTGLGYHCRKCRTAKIRPSPSHEARCLCKSGIRGKHCFDYHPAEARVDWEKEARALVNNLPTVSRTGLIEFSKDDPKALKKITHALSAAFEKGREAR